MNSLTHFKNLWKYVALLTHSSDLFYTRWKCTYLTNLIADFFHFKIDLNNKAVLKCRRKPTSTIDAIDVNNICSVYSLHEVYSSNPQLDLFGTEFQNISILNERWDGMRPLETDGTIGRDLQLRSMHWRLCQRKRIRQTLWLLEHWWFPYYK